jgi:hypothetical protein
MPPASPVPAPDPTTGPSTGNSAGPARRLQVVPAPSWQPPGRAPRPTSPGVASAVQGTLALAYVLPGGLPAEPSAPDLALAPAPRRAWEPTDADDEPPDRTARAQLTDPRMWAARLGQAVLEVRSGSRPVTQLLRWTSAPVYAELALHRSGPTLRRESVRSVHVCEPADGVAEAALVVAGGDRLRAVALRLEGLRGRWVCTALVFG